MKLETDLKIIEQSALAKFKENLSFFEYLKTKDSSMIDELVFNLNDIVTSEISCVECGNCCHHLRPAASVEELSLFVAPDQIEKVMYEPSIQCMHQKDKMCTKYLERPEVCRTFPYLHLDGFVLRASGMVQNCEICPQVYHVVELLKKELGWSYNL